MIKNILTSKIMGVPLHKCIEVAIFAVAFLFVAGRIASVLMGMEVSAIQRQYLIVSCALLSIALISSGSFLDVLSGEASFKEKVREPFGVSWSYLLSFSSSFIFAWAISSMLPSDVQLAGIFSLRILAFTAVLIAALSICQYPELQAATASIEDR